jgi:rhodanese-related sulfurtransferase
MGCCKSWMIVVQMGLLVAVGGAIGYVDQQRRPVMVTPPEIAPLPAKPIEAPTPPTDAVAPSAGTPEPSAVTPAEPAKTTPPTNAGSGEQAAPAPAGEQIDPELVKQGHITVVQGFELFGAAQPAFFLDARRKDIYEAGHVRDSFRMPLDAFKGKEPAHFAVMPREETYVVYCEGGNCDESVAVQKQLLLAGYTKVYVMHAGYPGWVAAGHPTQTGPDPIEASEGRP